MAVIDTGLLTKGLRSEFFERFEKTPTHFQELATRVPSTTDAETYRWLGTVPRMREWGSGRLARGLRTERYSVENLKYESTIEVDRDEIADDQTGQIRVRIGELASRAATHKDYLLAQMLINGGSSGFESYDGVPFFSTNHVSGASGTQDNALAPVAEAVDNQPTTAEFRDSLKQAVSSILGFRDDQGDPLAHSASGLVCVVPPKMLFTALEGVNATLATGGSNVLEGAARVVAMPWLTDGATYYLLKTDGVLRPFIFQDREPVEFGALAENSEDGFKREKLLFGVRARYRMAYGYWQQAVRVAFT